MPKKPPKYTKGTVVHISPFHADKKWYHPHPMRVVSHKEIPIAGSPDTPMYDVRVYILTLKRYRVYGEFNLIETLVDRRNRRIKMILDSE